MGYYVVLPTGLLDGPVDVVTLNALAAEGQLNPTSQVVDIATGIHIAAKDVPELVFPADAPPPTETPITVETRRSKYWAPHMGPEPLGPRGGSGPPSNYTASYWLSLISATVACLGGLGIFLGIMSSLAAIGLATNIRYASPQKIRMPVFFAILALAFNLSLWWLGALLGVHAVVGQ